MYREQKALKINLDPMIYGVIAEIGAGQEVAGSFFRAGGASGTIAKTMSAYDMAVSDAVYGKVSSGRYVCEERVERMLNHEYGQLISRLEGARGEKTQFFVYANTVATTSFKANLPGHGWMAVRFQESPKSPPSDVTFHTHFYELQTIHQQQTVGHLGINLIDACFYARAASNHFLDALLEGLDGRRINIDYIKFSGPAFVDFNHQLIGLELIKRGFTKSIFFDETGKMQGPAEAFYKRPVVCLRGSFCPPTLVSLDMFKTGKSLFLKIHKDFEEKDIICFAEISMNRLKQRGEVLNEDFLNRVALLRALKIPTLISHFDTYGDLVSHLSSLKVSAIGLILGIYNLFEIFQNFGESKDQNLLYSVGKIFSPLTKGLIYPGTLMSMANTKFDETYDDNLDAKLYTTKSLPLSAMHKEICQFLVRYGLVNDIEDFDAKVTKIWSRSVFSKIQNKESGWEKMVPTEIISLIKQQY